jgi:pimeloyl-ACP methyl ester carboxylesterase
MKIYAISGLGADKRVFSYLSLDHEIIPLDWILPLKKEGIESYSKRLAESYNIDQDEDFVLLGLSFGGIVATEMSKIFQPKLTILISSIETKSELSVIFKLAGKSKLLSLIPEALFNPPKRIAHFLFGTKQKKLLNSILNETDLKLAKWSVNELINWKNETKLNNVLKISGSNDKLLPIKDKNAIIIEKGEHFMIVDRAKEISEIINKRLEK